MFGTLIANKLLKQLVQARTIDIDPFDETFLKSTHFTLQPGKVLRRSDKGEWLTVHVFAEAGSFVLEPNEYVVVEIRQRVRILGDGIVGRFVTTSSHVEGGLLVVAGQIDSQYGVNGELLRVGVKNLLTFKNELKKDTRLVHLEFFDLRGLAVDPSKRTAAEEKTWARRRPDPGGDGPNYGRED